MTTIMSTNINNTKSFKTKLKTIKKELMSTSTYTLTRCKSTTSSTTSTVASASASTPYSSPYSSNNTSPRSVVSATFVSSTPDLSQQPQHSSSSTFRYRSSSFSQPFVKLTQINHSHQNNKHSSPHFLHLPLHAQRQSSNTSTTPLSSPSYEPTYDTCIPLDYDHFTYTNTASPKLTPEEDESCNGNYYHYYDDSINSSNNDNKWSSHHAACIKEEVIIPPLPDIHEFSSRHNHHHHQSAPSIIGNNSSTSLNRYNNSNNNSNGISRNGSANMSRSVSLDSTNLSLGDSGTPTPYCSNTHSKTNSVDERGIYGKGEKSADNENAVVGVGNNEGNREDDLATNILSVINMKEISWDI
ncbi:hypothetical protein CANMA_005074 [Candida margitis]|uniref:uncharacterized protein n=1 Tax=Candida margitis TaxID=1775924 RepID=UPI002226015A|nr:uncharacterized protein CANMA_005074 [Candida margitis]KAI5952198.1 hypothetical protein CANMA_005074 [Candida margitis]